MDSKQGTFDFSQALALLKIGRSLSRLAFRDTCYIEAQFPDKHSKMTKPYLFMWKKVQKELEDGSVALAWDRFPFDPSCESLFAEDWYVV